MIEDRLLQGVGLTTNPNDFFIGGVQLGLIPEISDPYIKRKQSNTNQLLQMLDIDDISRQIVQVNQLTTLEEFSYIFTERPNLSKPVFTRLNIKTNEARHYFTQRYENDLKGYKAFLQDYYPTEADFFLRWLKAHIPEKELIKHTYIVAGSRSGKSELLKVLIHNHIRKKKNGLVIIDPSGKLSQEVAEFKEFADPETRKRLVLFDPYLGHQNGVYPVLNPFTFTSKDVLELDKATDELTKVINSILSDKNAGFSDQMELIIKRIVAVLLYKGNASFEDLTRFFYDGDNEDLIELGKKHPNESVKEFFTKRWGIDDGLKISIPSLKTRIENFTGNSILRAVTTGKNTIDLENALDSGKYLIFNLSKGSLSEDLGIQIGKLIIAQIQVLSLQRQVKKPSEYKPVHIFIDEMQNFITQSIEQVLTESAKYKIYLTLANQYTGQTNRSTSATNFYKALLGNTGVKIIGRAGHNTRADMSKEMSIKESYLEKLTKGKFYVKIEGCPPVLFEGSTRLLDKANSMKPEQWETVIKEQLDLYYRPKTKRYTAAPPTDGSTAPPPPPPMDDKINQRKTKFNPKFDF